MVAVTSSPPSAHHGVSSAVYILIGAPCVQSRTCSIALIGLSYVNDDLDEFCHILINHTGALAGWSRSATLHVVAPLTRSRRCGAAVLVVLIVALVPLFCKLVKHLTSSLDERLAEGKHLGST